MSSNPAQLKQAMASYGQFDLSKQVAIVCQLLENAKQEANEQAQLIQKIANAQKILKTATEAKAFIERLNRFVVDLEQEAKAKPVLNYLKANGLYRMLYHTPKFKGEDMSKDHILRLTLRNGFWGVGIALLITAAFAVASVMGAPALLTTLLTGLFAGSCAYLSG